MAFAAGLLSMKSSQFNGPYQQNLPQHHVGIIVLTDSNWLILRNNSPAHQALLVAVEAVRSGEVSVVEVL